MHWLLYLRLFTLTAGTLLPFFWMVVILGHRRQRNFERVFFFLCLALTCFFGSTLLALNAELFYSTPPHGLLRLAWSFLCLGLWSIPPLVIHLHTEYAALRGLFDSERRKLAWLVVAWLPPLLLAVPLFRVMAAKEYFAFETPSRQLGLAFQVWLLSATGIGVYWQWRFTVSAPDMQQRAFHKMLKWDLAVLWGWLGSLIVWERLPRLESGALGISLAVMLMALFPLGALIGQVQRFNFLSIGRQHNLIYAVFGVFLALLYLSLIRRASQWLEPFLPPEATAALLLFLPVVFFEPLQRMVRGSLQGTTQAEMDRISPLAVQIHNEARGGDPASLLNFTEKVVRSNLQFEDVWIQILEPKLKVRPEARRQRSRDESFSLYRPGRLNGVITVRPHGAMISGESVAAMRFLTESIAGAIDTCIVLEEKLQLERELAARARMALVGQMAASISHNLKNPLGAIKTILQVQMESADLPAALRGETQMVLDEINRLSAKLNQLLQFSRPGVRPSKGDHCNIMSVAMNVAEVLCREAESKGVSLELGEHASACDVAASSEAVNDILSNVVLNAIEAVPRCGGVSIGVQCDQQSCTMVVEDDGPGIPPALKERVLQPFYTTKARGTGLGLAIVARRLEEIGGSLEIESPVQNEHGTRFRLRFPLAQKGQSE